MNLGELTEIIIFVDTWIKRILRWNLLESIRVKEFILSVVSKGY